MHAAYAVNIFWQVRGDQWEPVRVAPGWIGGWGEAPAEV